MDVGGDQPLGERGGLADEEPVPPGCGKAGVATSQGFADRHVAKDDHPADAPGMVECQPLHDIAAAIVADGVEPAVAEGRHAPPRSERTWVPVHKQYRRSLPAIPDSQAYLTDVDKASRKPSNIWPYSHPVTEAIARALTLSRRPWRGMPAGTHRRRSSAQIRVSFDT